MPQINRRSLVLSLCGLALTGPQGSVAGLPLVTDETPDAELIRLGREFDALVALETPLRAEVSRLWGLFDAHLPGRPEELRVRRSDLCVLELCRQNTDRGDNHWYGSEDIRMLRGWLRPQELDAAAVLAHRVVIDIPQTHSTDKPTHSARARAEQIVAAWNSWEAAKQQLQDEIRIVTVENRLLAVQREMQKRIDVILMRQPKPSRD